jgi:type IV pilus assembly protein PilF
MANQLCSYTENMCKIYFLSTVWLVVFFSALGGCASKAEYSLHAPDIHVNLGMTYLQHGNLPKARSAFNQALLDQPLAPMSWGAMGYLEELSGNLTLAAADYRQAIKLAPAQGESHNNYGVFLCRHHQQRAGIKELLIAAQLPSYIERAAAYENAALCALSIPDHPAAQQYFAAARRNKPGARV